MTNRFWDKMAALYEVQRNYCINILVYLEDPEQILANI